jgi:hypothetical protein
MITRGSAFSPCCMTAQCDGCIERQATSDQQLSITPQGQGRKGEDERCLR